MEQSDQWRFEAELHRSGIVSIAGVDEVGRGCLAGPVVAASVILPKDCRVEGIKDSKLLSPKKREKLFDLILESAVAYSIGIVGPKEIDEINIFRASLKAMKLSVETLPLKPQYILIDGNQELNVNIEQRAIVKGDRLSITIGAASIVAKVVRDRMMVELEKEYPDFSFSVHKGYGTKKHLEEIKKHGPTKVHRYTFSGVKEESKKTREE